MKNLADFEKPPLIEVVHGVQFKPLNLSIIDPGRFYKRISDRYPQVQAREPLAPVREAFGPASFMHGVRFQMAQAAEMPRAWFISQDNARIVQLQRDRLLYNWRLVDQGAPYPRYPAMLEEFSRLHDELNTYAVSADLGTTSPDQVELTYISHFFPRDDSAEAPNPASVLRIWNDELGPEWSSPIEDVNFNVRYHIMGSNGAPIGRIYASLTTLLSSDGKRLLQLELTARGTPESADWTGVTGFLELAHEQIVQCFLGITTPAAHAAWRRR